MSPRAACRLEALGFDHVHDYVPGKVDWRARGLAREGDTAAQPRAIDVLRDDAVTCGLADRVGDVGQRVEASPYGFALIIARDGTLLGRLRRAALEGRPDAAAEEAMEPEPSTVRADLALDRLRERLDRTQAKTAVVTTPEGALLGLVRRADLR